MSQWQSQVRDHLVWQHLQALGPLVDQASSQESIDAAGVDLVQRLRSVLTFIGKRLAAIDPALIAVQALDGLGTQLQPMLSELQSFVSDGQVGRLVTLNACASEALMQLARLPGVVAHDDLTALSEAAASYRSTMEQIVDQSRRGVTDLKAEAASFSEKLIGLTNEVAGQRASVTALTSDFQGQFSSAQETRAREFTEQQGTRQKEHGDAQTARQTRFDDLHASFTQKLNDQSAEFVRQGEALHREAGERLAKVDRDYQVSAQAILDVIEARRNAVEKLVGVIGTLGVTSGYQKVAESARKSMWLWQGFTLLGFVIVIGFAILAFLPAIQGEFSWERFAGRLVLTVTVGLFAAYSASQADRYMEAERRNRKLALELEAVGPYLAPLPEDRQQEFRLALGDRTFGREEQAFGRRDKSPATVIDMLMKSKEFREFITEVAKAVRG